MTKMSELQKSVIEVAKSVFDTGSEIKTSEVAEILEVSMPKVRGCLAGLYRRGLIAKGKKGFTVVEGAEIVDDATVEG